jgi:uncharacterized protein with GYD domain
MSRKVWAIVLAALLMLAFVACGGDDPVVQGSTQGNSSKSNSGSTSSGSETSIIVEPTAMSGSVVITGDTAADGDGDYSMGVVLTATYTGNVSSAGLLRYQWEKTGELNPDIAGATNASYTPSVGGSYFVRVSAVGYTGFVGPKSGDNWKSTLVLGPGQQKLDGTASITVQGGGVATLGSTLVAAYTGGTATQLVYTWYVDVLSEPLGHEQTVLVTTAGEYSLIITANAENFVGEKRAELTVTYARPSSAILAFANGDFEAASDTGFKISGCAVMNDFSVSGSKSLKFSTAKLTSNTAAYVTATNGTTASSLKLNDPGTKTKLTFWVRGSNSNFLTNNIEVPTDVAAGATFAIVLSSAGTINTTFPAALISKPNTQDAYQLSGTSISSYALQETDADMKKAFNLPYWKKFTIDNIAAFSFAGDTASGDSAAGAGNGKIFNRPLQIRLGRVANDTATKWDVWFDEFLFED